MYQYIELIFSLTTDCVSQSEYLDNLLKTLFLQL